MGLKKLISILLLCLSTFFLLSPKVRAQGAKQVISPRPIGTVALIQGEVWRVKDQAENKKNKVNELLAANSKIYENDTIETGPKSYVKILMEDDTIFDLGGSSKLKFAEFKAKSKSDRKSLYQFLYGKMRSLFTVPSKEGKIKIDTPNISMGVRGTEILTNVDLLHNSSAQQNQASNNRLESSNAKTEVALLSGSVDINLKGPAGHLSKSFKLEKGVAFNTESLIKGNDLKKAMTRLTTRQLTQLKNPAPFKSRPQFLFEKKGSIHNKSPDTNELKQRKDERKIDEIRNQMKGSAPDQALQFNTKQKMESKFQQKNKLGNQNMRARCQLREFCRDVPIYQNGAVTYQKECRKVRFPPGCQN